MASTTLLFTVLLSAAVYTEADGKYIQCPKKQYRFRTLLLEQLSYMAGYVTNLATKYEDPTPIYS